jgi:hypothetical protein
MNSEVDRIAIQDTYGERFQHCWGCGPKNKDGLHIKSYPSEDGTECICHVIPSDQYTGGVPDNLFGGMIAMIFDCHGTASAAWFSHKNKGLELTKDTVIERFITARLEIDYKKPTPMGKEITVKSRLEELTEKKAIVTMDLESEGSLRAQGRIITVKVKDNM